MSSSQRKTLLLSEDIHSLGSPLQLPDLSMARLETASTCLCCRSSHDGGHCAVRIGDSKLPGIFWTSRGSGEVSPVAEKRCGGCILRTYHQLNIETFSAQHNNCKSGVLPKLIKPVLLTCTLMFFNRFSAVYLSSSGTWPPLFVVQLWYNGDIYQLRKVISYYLDKVDTNHLVIKTNNNS